MWHVTTPFVVAMAAPGQPAGWVQFLPFAMILAIFYFLLLLPMKRRRHARTHAPQLPCGQDRCRAESMIAQPVSAASLPTVWTSTSSHRASVGRFSTARRYRCPGVPPQFEYSSTSTS